MPIDDENLQKGKLDIVCKAVDTAYNTQPESPEHVSINCASVASCL